MLTLRKVTDSDIPNPTETHACAWTPAACRASQDQHGRGDDCPDHPWASPEYPSHAIGLGMNDLASLHSLMVCNALRGHLGLSMPSSTAIMKPDHRRCRGCRTERVAAQLVKILGR